MKLCKGFGGSGGYQVNPKPGACLHSRGVQQLPRLDEEECQQVKGGDPSSLLNTGEIYLQFCVQLWALQYKRDMDLLERVLCRTVKTKVSEAERSGTVQPSEKNAQEASSTCVNI